MKRWLFPGIAGALISSISFYIYRRYQREIKQSYLQIQSGSRLILTDYGTMEYATSGNGSPLMIIHGIGGGYDHGLLVGKLIEEQFRIIAPSRFGYLRSMYPPDASPATQADVFAAILDDLELSDAAIAGVSAGGPSAIQFALRYPERCSCLLLVSAVSHNFPLTDHGNGIFENAYRKDFTGWMLVSILRPIIRLFRDLGKMKQPISPQEKKWAESYYVAALPTSRRYIGTRADLIQIKNNSDSPLEAISSPTLIIHAEDDPVVPVEHAQFANQQIPNAELVTFPIGGHMLLGNHSRINQIITDFLNQHVNK